DPFPGQEVCFSSLVYDPVEALDGKTPMPSIGKDTGVLLLTGIARPGPLLARVQEITPHVTHLKYPDHHSFTVKNIAKIAEIFEGIGTPGKIILTTEKDAARLRADQLEHMVRQLPVFYWPVRVHIHEPGSSLFRERVLQFG